MRAYLIPENVREPVERHALHSLVITSACHFHDRNGMTWTVLLNEDVSHRGLASLGWNSMGGRVSFLGRPDPWIRAVIVLVLGLLGVVSVWKYVVWVAMRLSAR